MGPLPGGKAVVAVSAEREGTHRLSHIIKRLAPQPHPVSVTLPFVILSAAIWGGLYFAVGAPLLPGAPAFAALLIWLCAIVCADAAAWLRLPRVVGMLLAGLALANAPGSPAVALPPLWGSQMRAAGLAVIYLRCGLALEWRTLAQYKGPALKLALIPGLVEMLFDAALAVAVFQMPWLLAITLGSLLQAVGPALLVPLLFTFQQQRLGTHQGIPQSAIVSASFDDIIAITWFSIFSCLAITGEGNVGWQIARGPTQVVIGGALGAALGACLSLTRVWDTQNRRLAAALFGCLLLMFVMVRFDMLSGGALGSLAAGMSAAALWRRGLPRAPALGLGPAPEFADDLDACISLVWDWVAEPLIFGTIGASINFATLPPFVAGRAALIVTAGLAVRMLVTYNAMWEPACSGPGPGGAAGKLAAAAASLLGCAPRCGARAGAGGSICAGSGGCAASGSGGGGRGGWRVRLFYAIAWTPKATVQAALSGAPLHMARLLKAGSPDFDDWVRWGHEIQATGVICILVCATLGTLLVELLGPKLLDQAPNAEEEKEALAAVAEADAAAVPEGQAAEATPLSNLTLRYMHLAAALRHHAAGQRAGTGGGGGASGGGVGPPVGRAHSSSSAAAVWGGSDSGARRPRGSSGGGGGGGDGAFGEWSGAGALPVDDVVAAMERLEGHMARAIGRRSMSVRKALQLESMLGEPHDAAGRASAAGHQRATPGPLELAAPPAGPPPAPAPLATVREAPV